jgi:hypothetical protein
MNRITHISTLAIAGLLLIAAAAFAVSGDDASGSASKSEEKSEAKSDRGLKAGDEGTTLESITVEGEDRIQIDFERPALVVDVDPLSAPGLDWDIVWSLLGPGALDLYAPLPERSRMIRSPYRARPWADSFRRGDIVRFRPSLEGVENWSLTIADSRGTEVKKFAGKGSPPDQIEWDGRADDGTVALTGRRYSFVVEAADRAGNKRRFVGEGFQLPAYAIESKSGVSLMLSGSDLETESKNVPPAQILYAATRANQLPVTAQVHVVVTSADYRSGEALAGRVAEQIRALVIGDGARVTTTVAVEQGSSDAAVVIHIGTATVNAAN